MDYNTKHEEKNINTFLDPTYPWIDNDDKLDDKKRYISDYLNEIQTSNFLYGMLNSKENIIIYISVYKLTELNILAKIFNTKYGMIVRYQPNNNFKNEQIYEIFHQFMNIKYKFFLPNNYDKIGYEDYEFNLRRLLIFSKRLKLPGSIISHLECNHYIIFIFFDCEYAYLDQLEKKWKEFITIGLLNQITVHIEESKNILEKIKYSSRISIDLNDNNLIINYVGDIIDNTHYLNNFTIIEHNLNLDSELKIFGFICSIKYKNKDNIQFFPLKNHLLVFHSSKFFDKNSISYLNDSDPKDLPIDGVENFSQLSFNDFNIFEKLACIKFDNSYFSFFDFYKFLQLGNNKINPLSRRVLNDLEIKILEDKFKNIEKNFGIFLNGYLENNHINPILIKDEVLENDVELIVFYMKISQTMVKFWCIPNIKDKDFLTYIIDLLTIKWSSGCLFRPNFQYYEDLLCFFSNKALSFFSGSLKNKWEKNYDFNERLVTEVKFLDNL